MEEITIADKLIPSKPTIYSFLRIITGVIILIRGFNFIFLMANLRLLIQQTDVALFAKYSEALSVIIAIFNIACGLFITVGFFTRLSAVIQIPILFVAAFLVNMRNVGNNTFEFILSLITFFLVIIVAYKGSGLFSADEYFRRGAELDRRGENRM